MIKYYIVIQIKEHNFFYFKGFKSSCKGVEILTTKEELEAKLYDDEFTCKVDCTMCNAHFSITNSILYAKRKQLVIKND